MIDDFSPLEFFAVLWICSWLINLAAAKTRGCKKSVLSDKIYIQKMFTRIIFTIRPFMDKKETRRQGVF